MESILKFIGESLLSAANAIHEAKDRADDYFFDLLLEGHHLAGRTSVAPPTTRRRRATAVTRSSDFVDIGQLGVRW